MMLGRLFSKLLEYKQAGEIGGMDFAQVQVPDINPCHLVPKVNERPFARRQICTEDQFKRLLSYADDGMMDYLIMYIMTGLRGCDLTRLTGDNVDLKRGTLQGIQHKTITTRNPSGVPYLLKITERMKDILLARMARTKPGTPLFPGRGWQKRWEKLRELAGCQHIQRRDLRRSKATFLLDHGTDPLTVADSLGLTTLRMLPNYAPRTLEHQAKGLKLLEEVYE
jgi:integrase